MAGGGVVGSSPGNACTMPNADTRAGFAVTDTLTPPPVTVTLQEGGRTQVQDSAAATSCCIIINVRTNEADVAVKYDEGRQDMCRNPPPPATGLPVLSKQTGSCARSSICPATFDAFTQFFLLHYVYYCL